MRSRRHKAHTSLPKTRRERPCPWRGEAERLTVDVRTLDRGAACPPSRVVSCGLTRTLDYRTLGVSEQKLQGLASRSQTGRSESVADSRHRRYRRSHRSGDPRGTPVFSAFSPSATACRRLSSRLVVGTAIGLRDDFHKVGEPGRHQRGAALADDGRRSGFSVAEQVSRDRQAEELLVGGGGVRRILPGCRSPGGSSRRRSSRINC